VRAGERATPPLRVGPAGEVALPEPLRGRSFRLEILRAAFAPGTPGRIRQRRAVGIGELSGAGVPRVRVARAGRLRAPCGALKGTLGGAPIRLRPVGTLADLDAGRPLRMRGCGGPVALPAGPARLSLPATAFAPHLLRLRSAAPDPPATAAALPGRVVDPGEPGRNDWRDIRLELREPAWLVLAQSYNDAWRARCDGRDLGAPRPVDAFAMGWRVPAGCRTAELAFGPERAVRAGYAISLPALLAIALLLLARRPPAPVLEAPPADLASAPPPSRMRPARAALLAVAAGAVLGFIFAARAAPLIALGMFLLLWRGVGVRGLVAAAGALLAIAVPAVAFAVGAENRGGYNPEYPVERIAAHWVAVAAVILLMLALARELGAMRLRRPRAPRRPPPRATAPGPAPRRRPPWRWRAGARP
jgi:hypothetical protein